MTEYLLSVPTISVFHSSFWCYWRSLTWWGKLSNYILVNLCVFSYMIRCRWSSCRDALERVDVSYMIDQDTYHMLPKQGRDSNGGKKSWTYESCPVLKVSVIPMLFLSSTQKVRLSWDKAYPKSSALRRRNWCVSASLSFISKWRRKKLTAGAWIGSSTLLVSSPP